MTVPVREAATILLVRDADPVPGIEVFVQHRVATMRFAAGMTVFPGGGVEPRDYGGTRPWRGPGPEWWAGRFGVSPERAAAAVRGVVRELYEETGVLLAETPDGGAAQAPEASARHRLAAGQGTIDDVLAGLGLAIAAHRMRPWARWTTPPGPPRRYDTLFFLAGVDDRMAPDGLTSEARKAEWVRVEDAASRGSLGTWPMMRPTLDALRSLAHAGRVADLLAEERRIPEGGL